MDSSWSLGIDFGTSNTAAAHTNPVKGTIESINLSHNRTTMPSSVYIESTEEIDVGDVALNKAESNPAGFVPSPKRLVHQQVFQINGYDVASAVPISAVLASVVERASREHNNVPPQNLVLTHPEAWSEREINVLIEAVEKIGLSADSVRMVSEPQAAARYYSEARELLPGQKIAVFDFGGGTLDIAVLEAQSDGAFSVIAARGDNALGGKSFDALIRKWVDARLEDDDPEVLDYLRRKAPLSERHALEDSIRRAKELLSEAPQATITIPTDSSQKIHLDISRLDLEEVIAPGIERAVRLVQAALSDAGIGSSGDLAALYLTGGSSRIPAVQEALKDVGPVATLDDPKTVVAQGGLQAITSIKDGVIRVRSANTGAESPTEAVDKAQIRTVQEPSELKTTEKTRKSLFFSGVVLLLGIIVLITLFLSGNRINANGNDVVIAESNSEKIPSHITEESEQTTKDQSSENLSNPKEIAEAIPESLSSNLDKNGCLEVNEFSSAIKDDGVMGIECDVATDADIVNYFNPTKSYEGNNSFIFNKNKDFSTKLSMLINNKSIVGEGGGDPIVLGSIDDGNIATTFIDKYDGVVLYYTDLQNNLSVYVENLKSVKDAENIYRLLNE